MKIYLATWLYEKSQGVALTKKGSKTRLISFFHTKEKTDKEVRKYIKSGK